MTGNNEMWTLLFNSVVYESFIIIGMYHILVNMLNLQGIKKKIFFLCFFVSMLSINEIIFVQNQTNLHNRELIVTGLALLNTMFYIAVLKVLTKVDYIYILLADMISQIITGTIMSVSFIAVAALFHRNVDSLIEISVDDKNIFVIIILLTIMITAFLGIQFISKKCLSGFLEKKLKWKGVYWIFVILFNGGGYFVCIKNNLNSEESILIPTIAMAILFVVALYEVSWWVRFRTEKQIQEENRILNIENILMKEYYNTLNYQLELTRKFRHDIEKHMSVVKEMAEKQQTYDFTAHEEENRLSADKTHFVQLTELISEQCINLKDESYCDNPIINAMLINKKRICDKEDIKIILQISDFKLERIKEIDAIAVISNLLDNAIDECRNVKEQKDSQVEIVFSCNSKNDNLCIFVRNTTLKQEVVLEGRTTKKDQWAHGVGLSIVKDIVEKYNGIAKSSVRSEIYETRIWLRN